jgi:hypothetical protein
VCPADLRLPAHHGGGSKDWTETREEKGAEQQESGEPEPMEEEEGEVYREEDEE